MSKDIKIEEVEWECECEWEIEVDTEPKLAIEKPNEAIANINKVQKLTKFPTVNTGKWYNKFSNISQKQRPWRATSRWR